MHKLVKLVQDTMHQIITCPVCRLSVASCECDKQITDKALTLIALEGFHGLALVVTLEDEPLHTDDHPFCCDLVCPCHTVLASSTKDTHTDYYAEYISNPYVAGLYSYAECQRIFHNNHL